MVAVLARALFAPSAGGSGGPRLGLRRVALHVGVWLVVLGVGLALLRGRFDFAPAFAEFSYRSYVSTGFYFVLTMPTAFYLLAASPLRAWIRWPLSVGLFAMLTLPWRWLHLARADHYPPTMLRPSDPEPSLTFFPNAEEGFPHDKLFFFALFGAFAVGAVAVAAFGTDQRRSLRESLQRVTMPVLAYAIICLQAFAHTSLRSGYSLNAYLVVEPIQRNWYLTYLFPPGGGRGAVSSDLRFWWSLDWYFQGAPKMPETMLIRRSYFSYLTSQFTYFVNPYLFYLAVNTLLWFAAAAAAYKLALSITERREVAALVFALVCVGNGFVYFVGQPFPYLAGYAASVGILWAYRRFLAPDTSDSKVFVIPVGMGMGLCALTYDLFPTMVALVAMAFVLRAGRLRSIAAVAIAVAVHVAFVKLQYRHLHLPEDRANTFMIDDAVQNLVKLARRPDLSKLYHLAVTFLGTAAQSFGYAFELVVLLLAVVGAWSVRAKRPLPRVVFVLVSPALLTAAFFHFGQARWYAWPMATLARIYYVAYPGVYLAAAMGLLAFRARLRRTPLAAIAEPLSWMVVVVLAVWQNADALGLVGPAFHFYFPDHGVWLDRK